MLDYEKIRFEARVKNLALEYEKLRFEAITKNLAQERAYKVDEEERLLELFTIAQRKRRRYFSNQESMELAFEWFKAGYKEAKK